MTAAVARRLPCMEPRAEDGGAVRLSCRCVGDVAEQARALLRAGTPVTVELTADDDVALAAVGELARLTLDARRCGTELSVLAPGAALRHLAELVGLCDVLRLDQDAARADEP